MASLDLDNITSINTGISIVIVATEESLPKQRHAFAWRCSQAYMTHPIISHNLMQALIPFSCSRLYRWNWLKLLLVPASPYWWCTSDRAILSSLTLMLMLCSTLGIRKGLPSAMSAASYCSRYTRGIAFQHGVSTALSAPGFWKRSNVGLRARKSLVTIAGDTTCQWSGSSLRSSHGKLRRRPKTR